MKKILFLLLLLSFVSNAQIVDIPDANFKAKLLEASQSNQIALDLQSQYFKIDVNDDGEIQLSEALNVSSLDLRNSSISSIEGILEFENIENINCDNNLITEIYLSNLESLVGFSCKNNALSSLVAENLFSLFSFDCSDNNQLNNLELNNLIGFNEIYCNNTSLINLSLNNVKGFYLLFNDNQISNLTLQNIDYHQFDLRNNLIENFILSNSNTGSYSPLDLLLNNNPLELIEINNCNLNSDDSNFLSANNTSLHTVRLINSNVNELRLGGNQINNVEVINSGFGILNLDSNLLIELDLSGYTSNLVNPQDPIVVLYNNPLNFLNLKNGESELFVYIEGLNDLNFICLDENEIEFFTEYLEELQIANVVFNSYCSFIPGGDYNTIAGNVQYDINNNGCDESDFSFPFFRLKVSIDGDDTSSSIFTNSVGEYNFYAETEGVYSFMPNIENPTFFNVSPQPGIAAIDEIDNTTTNLDFCISANGVHPDLEIVIAPVFPARPGFEAVYKIVYKNKGNQIMSQEYGVNFFYNQNLMNFVSSSVVPSSQVPGGLQWSFENLMPFESRSVEVNMVINPPTDSDNPVNIGDELIFTSVILPQAGDENVQDNTFVLNQTVVGSYDPNDITCLQGDVVSPDQIGEFLHYFIRFENTGNAAAENVVVKTEIDPTQFDINSLQMLSTSHNADIRMSGNKIEFIFQNIQLDSGGHGNILLKMRSNEVLEVGDIVEKKANIYFDYNFPIETNRAETLFQALSVVNPVLDNIISIYPNPVKDIVNITIKNNSTIKTIELYDIQGRLLQTQLVNNITSDLNLSSRANGMYFIKINTDKGSKVEKLIKE